MLKHELNNPSIGIMLCKTKDKLTAHYALKDINKPIGVSEYRLSDFVPTEFIDTLLIAIVVIMQSNIFLIFSQTSNSMFMKSSQETSPRKTDDIKYLMT